MVSSCIFFVERFKKKRRHPCHVLVKWLDHATEALPMAEAMHRIPENVVQGAGAFMVRSAFGFY